MRICVFNWRDLAHPASGGAEVYTEQVLRRWVAAGHDVTLVAAAVAGRPADEMVDGYHVVRRGSRLGVYGAARQWWSENGRGRFDLVIDTTNTVPFFAHEWVDDGARVIGMFHQTCEEIWRFNAPPVASTLGRHILEPSWLRRYRGVPVLAVSDSTRDALARFGVDRVEVVPEGFEPPAVPVDVRKESRPTLVFCARMVPYKRPQDVVEAAVIARRQMPDLQVWMIGGGDDLEALRSQAPPGVEYLGRVSEDEKLRRMAAAHGHVATSIREIQGETQSAVTKITAGASRVNRGVELANHAGEALSRIVSGASGLQGMLRDIASSTQEQSAASTSITEAVARVRSVANESNEGAIQAAQAAMLLSKEAEQLQALVKRFRTS